MTKTTDRSRPSAPEILNHQRTGERLHGADLCGPTSTWWSRVIHARLLA